MSHTHEGAIDAIYGAAALPEGWPGALEYIAEYVGGTGAMLVFNDLNNNSGFLTTARLREDLGRVYMRDYVRNPITQAMVEQVVGAPVTASSIVGQERLRRSAMYADIIAPQRIVDLVCMAQPGFSRRGTTGGIGITVNERQADNVASLIGRLARLAPHLARATDLSIALARASARTSVTASLIEAMPHAAMLLDAQARLLCANSFAHALLEKNDGLGLGAGDRLVASLPNERSRLDDGVARALAGSVAGTPAVPPAIRLARLSGSSAYLIQFTPLPVNASALRAMVTHEAKLLVQIIDPAAPLALAASHLRSTFEFTEAEARVALLVGSGQSVPQTAALLGIGASTVKTHLARCFDKSGARSQVALARLLASISPPLPRSADAQPGPTF